MLCLILQIGDTRYALDARQVLEVLPLVDAEPGLSASPGVVGLMNYRGEPTPIVDLSLLYCGRPARNLFSTRIVLVRAPCPVTVADPLTPALSSSERERVPETETPVSLIGLIAERATETRQFSANAFVAPEANRSVGFEFSTCTNATEMIHQLELSQLFRRLFGEPIPSRKSSTLPWNSTPSPSY